ncbi:MAG: TolC family protein [Cytophagales bacterium]
MIDKNLPKLVLFLIVAFIKANAQTILTEKEAVEQALQNNPQMKVAGLKIEKQQRLKGAAVTFENLEVIMQAPIGDEFRPAILQRFSFPTVYTNQLKIQKNNVAIAESEQGITTNNLIFNVRTTFNSLNYLAEKYKSLRRQDSIFNDIIEINDIRYRVGQISNLEKINGEAYYKQIQFNLLQTLAALQNEKIQLAILIGRPQDTSITSAGNLVKIVDYEVNQLPDTNFATNPLTQYYQKQRIASNSQLSLEQNRRLPGLVLGYFDQSSYSNSLYRFQFGVTLPIWYWTYGSKIGAAKKDVEIALAQSTYNNYQLKGEYSKELSQLRQYRTAVNYFETVGNDQSREIIKSARESYRLGSIGYYIYLQNLNQAFQIQQNSLEALKNYNQSIIRLQYVLGEQKY